MSPSGSVTAHIKCLLNGDSDGPRHLWERYYPRLVRLARARLRGARRLVADEEDIVLSAFDSFCRGASRGRFPRLDDRESLWRLLALITARKALDLIEYEHRARHGDALRGDDSARAHADAVFSREPGPAEAALAADELRRLFERLGDDRLRAIAAWKLEGHTNDEIARLLDRSPGTVERKLQLIRLIWSQA